LTRHTSLATGSPSFREPKCLFVDVKR
jgi:hypothetical protein